MRKTLGIISTVALMLSAWGCASPSSKMLKIAVTPDQAEGQAQPAHAAGDGTESVIVPERTGEGAQTTDAADAIRTDGSDPRYLPPPAIAPEAVDDHRGDPGYLPPPAIAPESMPSATQEFGVVCTGSRESVDNFPGFVRCSEGYCKDTLTAERIECPNGRPEGVSSFPSDVTCRAWAPLEGHEFIYHCIEGYCFDRHSNSRIECPADTSAREPVVAYTPDAVVSPLRQTVEAYQPEAVVWPLREPSVVVPKEAQVYPLRK